MVSWRAYSFECEDETRVEEFSRWLSDYGLVEFPDYMPEEEMKAVMAMEKEGENKPADAALIENMFYAHSMYLRKGLLRDSAEFWDRAASVWFNVTTETAEEVVFYECDGDTPREIATYRGRSEWGGLDLVYLFSVRHDFRFRCFAVDSPSMKHVGPILGATHELRLDEDILSDLIDLTGVEPSLEKREQLLASSG